MSTSLIEIQKKYSDKNVNLLMPASSEAQINPFYKFTVMEVKSDISENSRLEASRQGPTIRPARIYTLMYFHRQSHYL